MSLFQRKKEEQDEKGCCLKKDSDCQCKQHTSLKVLGSGCKSCHKLYENAKTAVKEMGLTIDVEYITDMEKIMTYGVMSMPAVVIDEQIASVGQVLSIQEIKDLL